MTKPEMHQNRTKGLLSKTFKLTLALCLVFEQAFGEIQVRKPVPSPFRTSLVDAPVRDIVNLLAPSKPKTRIPDPSEREFEALRRLINRDLQKASPEALRKIPSWGGRVAQQTKNLGREFKLMTIDLPIKAFEFYAPMGAIALYKCTVQNHVHPWACLEYILQFGDPAALVGILSFMVANHAVNVSLGIASPQSVLIKEIEKIMSRRVYDSTGRKIVFGSQLTNVSHYAPSTARLMIANTLGLTAGMMLSEISVDFMMDPHIDYVASMIWKERTPEENKLYDQAWDEISKKWMTLDGLARMYPMFVSNTVSGTASMVALRQLGLAIGKQEATAVNAKLAATQFIEKNLSKHPSARFMSPILRSADDVVLRFGVKGGSVLFNTIKWASRSNFVSALAFFATDEAMRPYVEEAHEELKASGKVKVAETTLNKALSLATDEQSVSTQLQNALYFNENLREYNWTFKEQLERLQYAWYLNDYAKRNRISGLEKINDGDVAQTLTIAIAGRLEAGKKWREALKHRYTLSNYEWTNFLNSFLSDQVSMMQYYSDFISAKDQINIPSDLATSYVYLRAINKGVMNWTTLKHFTRQEVDLASKAIDLEIAPILILLTLMKEKNLALKTLFGDTPALEALEKLKAENHLGYVDNAQRPHGLRDVIAHLNSLEPYEKRLRVEAINHLIPTQKALSDSKPSLLSEIELKKQKNEGAPDIDIAIIDPNSAVEYKAMSMGGIALPMLKGVSYKNTAEKMLLYMGCGGNPYQPLVVNRPLSPPRFLPPMMTSASSKEYCNRHFAQEPVKVNGQVVSAANFIAKNLRPEIDTLPEFERWLENYALPNSESEMKRHYAKRKKMIRELLAPAWSTQELQDAKRWWSPEAAERGENIWSASLFGWQPNYAQAREHWESFVKNNLPFLPNILGDNVLTSFATKAVKSLFSEGPLADPKLLKYPLPRGIYRSIVSDIDLNLRLLDAITPLSRETLRTPYREYLEQILRVAAIPSKQFGSIVKKYDKYIDQMLNFRRLFSDGTPVPTKPEFYKLPPEEQKTQILTSLTKDAESFVYYDQLGDDPPEGTPAPVSMTPINEILNSIMALSKEMELTEMELSQ